MEVMSKYPIRTVRKQKEVNIFKNNYTTNN